MNTGVYKQMSVYVCAHGGVLCVVYVQKCA